MRFSFERQRSRLAFGTAPAPRPDLLPDVGVEEVESAVVTRFARHRTERRGFWTTTGAVHRADGNLVPTSVRIGGVSGDQVRPDDPARIELAPAALLEGRWLYIGNWMRHFGHFLTETLTTLWIDDDAVDGVLASARGSDRRVDLRALSRSLRRLGP